MLIWGRVANRSARRRIVPGWDNIRLCGVHPLGDNIDITAIAIIAVDGTVILVVMSDTVRDKVGWLVLYSLPWMWVVECF